MTVPTPQSQAVQTANTILGLAGTLMSLYTQINSAVQAFSDTGAANFWGNFPTAATNADGTIGLADSNPTAGHVIDTRIITGLSRSASSADLQAAVSTLQSIQTYLNGTGDVPQTGGVRLSLNKLIGG